MKKKTIAAVATGVLTASLWAVPTAGADVAPLKIIVDQADRQTQTTAKVFQYS